MTETPQELIKAARQAREQLGPLAAEKATQNEHLTLQLVMARWAEVASSRARRANGDDFAVEVTAAISVLGVRRGKRTLLAASMERLCLHPVCTIAG